MARVIPPRFSKWTSHKDLFSHPRKRCSTTVRCQHNPSGPCLCACRKCETHPCMPSQPMPSQGQATSNTFKQQPNRIHKSMGMGVECPAEATEAPSPSLLTLGISREYLPAACLGPEPHATPAGTPLSAAGWCGTVPMATPQPHPAPAVPLLPILRPCCPCSPSSSSPGCQCVVLMALP